MCIDLCVYVKLLSDFLLGKTALALEPSRPGKLLGLRVCMTGSFVMGRTKIRKHKIEQWEIMDWREKNKETQTDDFSFE